MRRGALNHNQSQHLIILSPGPILVQSRHGRPRASLPSCLVILILRPHKRAADNEKGCETEKQVAGPHLGQRGAKPH
jgi:hypothetical protein